MGVSGGEGVVVGLDWQDRMSRCKSQERAVDCGWSLRWGWACDKEAVAVVLGWVWTMGMNDGRLLYMDAAGSRSSRRSGGCYLIGEGGAQEEHF